MLLRTLEPSVEVTSSARDECNMHGDLVFIEISIILEGMVMNALTFI